jgi:hypothetical protein
MRFFLKPDKPVLNWLLDHDVEPHILPVFPEDDKSGLVVAHLLSGGVVAEVIPTAEHVVTACGNGIPLGRLYFQIPRSLLYNVCDGLLPQDFLGGSAT